MDGDQNIGDMRIWRAKRRPNFDANDLQVLDLIRPAFVASLRRAQAAVTGNGDAARSTHAKHGAVSRESLSVREYQIVELAAKGVSDKEIAARLGISFTTVRTHINSAFLKLHVNNRVKLARVFSGSDS